MLRAVAGVYNNITVSFSYITAGGQRLVPTVYDLVQCRSLFLFQDSLYPGEAIEVCVSALVAVMISCSCLLQQLLLDVIEWHVHEATMSVRLL